MTHYYKHFITDLAVDEVFVFGSNLQGFHGAGAAGYASFGESGNVWRKYRYDSKHKGWRGKWNVKGKAEGPQIGREGKSYAVPTVTIPGARRSIPLEQIYESFEKLRSFADQRLHLKFFIAQQVSAGLNGYSGKEFLRALKPCLDSDNILIHESFKELIER